jgi:hypothetical protein
MRLRDDDASTYGAHNRTTALLDRETGPDLTWQWILTLAVVVWANFLVGLFLPTTKVPQWDNPGFQKNVFAPSVDIVVLVGYCSGTRKGPRCHPEPLCRHCHWHWHCRGPTHPRSPGSFLGASASVFLCNPTSLTRSTLSGTRGLGASGSDRGLSCDDPLSCYLE